MNLPIIFYGRDFCFSLFCSWPLCRKPGFQVLIYDELVNCFFTFSLWLTVFALMVIQSPDSGIFLINRDSPSIWSFPFYISQATKMSHLFVTPTLPFPSSFLLSLSVSFALFIQRVRKYKLPSLDIWATLCSVLFYHSTSCISLSSAWRDLRPFVNKQFIFNDWRHTTQCKEW